MSQQIPSFSRGFLLPLVLSLMLLPAGTRAADDVRLLKFQGVLSEHRLALSQLGPAFPTDWSAYTHLVIEMRTTTPQRFGLWAYTASGPRRIQMQPFGQNVWLRASIPLRYFYGKDQSGNDLASTNNRRTSSFWMSVWGPFGDLKAVEAIGFAMQYPVPGAAIEVRNIHLSREDEGSEFLEKTPVVDDFGQWAHVDWPRKIRSRQQLEKELAEEEKTFAAEDFGYGKFGGFQSTQAKATGFFRVEQIDGVWWFVDPEGHLFLCTSANGIGGGGGGRGGRGRGEAAAPTTSPIANRTSRRLDAWGINTGGQGRPNIAYFRAPAAGPTFLGVGDFYSDDFARGVDQAGSALAQRKDDPLLIGYFIGNEPPWGNRESEVVDMILAGPDTTTKARLKEFLAPGDTPKRRADFVVGAFAHYLDLVCSAIRKYDPNHLILGIRFGGKPADEVLRLAQVFDVVSINVYDYEPTKQLERAYRLTGRPILIGEFHIGVPENGLGSGLVQAMNQVERAKGYQYYVEQALSLPYALGCHWFQWRDQAVLGRMDGENYNIGLVDVNDRAYPEMVAALKATHKRLLEVHRRTVLPFSERPRASEVGSPSTPWDALDVRIGTTNQ